MHLMVNLNKSTKKLIIFAGLVICLFFFLCILWYNYNNLDGWVNNIRIREMEEKLC